ncbi:Rne/Rng family ribonuclease [Psychrobacter sp.]|uniref:Rne/Rng family ribonuclease n=1 Tax=Psychrobacter sp. TaxID=56811 RepID=UPI003F9A3954
MSEELLINISPMESRVAVLDNSILGEIYIERHNKLGLVGNIYLGTVVRVLPGMQAAFVDIGQSRTAFLHVNDMQREPRPTAENKNKVPEDSDQKTDNQTDNTIRETAENLTVTPPVVSVKSTEVVPVSKTLIQHRLHESQRILVQVTKDQLGSKGARLTTNISLPSRYLVYLPSSDHIGISQRIDGEEERTRLKSELNSLMQTVSLKGGLIARTAAERVPVAKLEEDIYYLLQLWRTICARRQEMNQHQSSELIYQELSLPLRSIRDLVHADTEKVIVDNTQIYEQVRYFAKEFVPFVYDRIVHYKAEQSLFDVHRVEDDLRDALKRRVDLKSGGYLIIDQTEAMTTIDVNTGSFVGGRSLEDTVYKTNLEATHAIARQLRLRNLGGIIILDFIDMLEQQHKDDVLESLQVQLTQDYAKTKITQVSELGLVEMTRKRTRESLGQQLCEPCSTCHGRGFVKQLKQCVSRYSVKSCAALALTIHRRSSRLLLMRQSSTYY